MTNENIGELEDEKRRNNCNRFFYLQKSASRGYLKSVGLRQLRKQSSLEAFSIYRYIVMAKIDGGATLWARQTIESQIFTNKPAEWFKIWFYVVNKVNHKNNKQFQRGQGFMKYEWIIYHTKATQSQVDHCLRWLKSAKQITTRKAIRGFYVTIYNYNLYQNLQTYKSDTKSDTVGEMKAKQKRNPIYNNNGKNVKNDIKDSQASLTELPNGSLTVKDKKKTELNTNQCFIDIWSRYPSKIGRKEAERHFRASVKNDENWRNINLALDNYLKSERVEKGYIQNGRTWFNNWQDWIEQPIKAKNADIPETLRPYYKEK